MRAMLLLAVVPGWLLAQTTPAPGDRVRVRVKSGQTYAGRLLLPVGDSIWIEQRRPGYIRYRLSPRVDSLPVAVSRVVRFEVSRGVRTHPGRGFLLGAAAGAALGVYLGTQVSSDKSTAIPAFALTFGTLGGVTGLVVGALTPSERWERVPPW